MFLKSQPKTYFFFYFYTIYLANQDKHTGSVDITLISTPTLQNLNDKNFFKVALSPSNKNCVICCYESLLKMMTNTFWFTLKAFFVLKIFKFLSCLLGHVEKTTRLNLTTSQPSKQTIYNTNIAQYLTK